jgi:hypothetical protein
VNSITPDIVEHHHVHAGLANTRNVMRRGTCGLNAELYKAARRETRRRHVEHLTEGRTTMRTPILERSNVGMRVDIDHTVWLSIRGYRSHCWPCTIVSTPKHDRNNSTTNKLRNDVVVLIVDLLKRLAIGFNVAEITECKLAALQG